MRNKPPVNYSHGHLGPRKLMLYRLAGRANARGLNIAFGARFASSTPMRFYPFQIAETKIL